MAGLPGDSAIVCVGPPLLARAPSEGSVFGRSPAAVRPQSFAVSMLWPREVTGPLQLDPVSAIPCERIVFLSVVVPPPWGPGLRPFPSPRPRFPPARGSFVGGGEPGVFAVIVPPHRLAAVHARAGDAAGAVAVERAVHGA